MSDRIDNDGKADPRMEVGQTRSGGSVALEPGRGHGSICPAHSHPNGGCEVANQFISAGEVVWLLGGRANKVGTCPPSLLARSTLFGEKGLELFEAI